ncbi:hypothetical protein ASE15_03500 [Oerskovia sp. Root22]|nr:hypothetical protein ASE15_03500 [Oerskovia sp. Root22]
MGGQGGEAQGDLAQSQARLEAQARRDQLREQVNARQNAFMNWRTSPPRHEPVAEVRALYEHQIAEVRQQD